MKCFWFFIIFYLLKVYKILDKIVGDINTKTMQEFTGLFNQFQNVPMYITWYFFLKAGYLRLCSFFKIRNILEVYLKYNNINIFILTIEFQL